MMQSSNHAPPLLEPTRYRRSMFERLGPDGPMLLRAAPYAAVVFACLLMLFGTLRRKLEYPGWLVLPLAAATTTAITWAGMRFARSIGETVGHFLLPTGESTPYEHQFSREEALVARGEIAGAVESLEAAIATMSLETPTGISVRIRAAELYMGKAADPKRAVALLREVQRHPGLPPSQDIYVSNRLIDLLLGPLDQPSRALFELRRIADRYPDSSAATHARAAIVTVKRRISEDLPTPLPASDG
jgi:hypothetical protein